MTCFCLLKENLILYRHNGFGYQSTETSLSYYLTLCPLWWKESPEEWFMWLTIPCFCILRHPKTGPTLYATQKWMFCIIFSLIFLCDWPEGLLYRWNDMFWWFIPLYSLSPPLLLIINTAAHHCSPPASHSSIHLLIVKAITGSFALWSVEFQWPFIYGISPHTLQFSQMYSLLMHSDGVTYKQKVSQVLVYQKRLEYIMVGM
jgi:hypothetical protein